MYKTEPFSWCPGLLEQQPGCRQCPEKGQQYDLDWGHNRCHNKSHTWTCPMMMKTRGGEGVPHIILPLGLPLPLKTRGFTTTTVLNPALGQLPAILTLSCIKSAELKHNKSDHLQFQQLTTSRSNRSQPPTSTSLAAPQSSFCCDDPYWDNFTGLLEH